MTTIHWINSTGGDFTDGADWSGGTVPGAGDNAVIDATGIYTVTLSSAERVGSLILDDGGATFTLGDGADLILGSNLTLKAGKFRFDSGATISGGTLSDKGGKTYWQGGTLDGVTYDGPLNIERRDSELQIGPNGLVLTGSDGTGPGVINLRLGEISFEGTQTITNTTINLNNADIDSGILTIGNTVLINCVNGGFIGGTAVVNEGTINAFLDPKNHVPLVFSTTFANEGIINISNRGNLYLDSPSFTNLVGGTLTGGDYEVDAGSSLSLKEGVTVVTDDAAITLSGAGSVIESQNSAHQEVFIDATLTTIGASGTLNLLEGRNWGSAANGITNEGTLVLGGGTFAPSAFTNSGLVSGSGLIGVAIANSGIIEAAAGTLDLIRAITGSGTMKIDAGAALEVDKKAASTQTVRFFAGTGTLDLATPSAFAATLHGFAPTDTIDLLKTVATAATLGAGDTLMITNNGNAVATLQLGGTYTGDTFNVASDGHGGTNITVTVPGAAHPNPSHQFIAAMAGLGGRGGGLASVMGAVHGEDGRLALSAPRMAQFA